LGIGGEMGDYRRVLRGLATALLEIRQTKSLDGAKVLADIFHKAPGMIAAGHSEDQIIYEIKKLSEAHNCWPQVSVFFEDRL
jgi:hypothetical protein